MLASIALHIRLVYNKQISKRWKAGGAMMNLSSIIPEASTAMPFCECLEGIYEIDEFDSASIFVIVGEERALVLDTGTGIGDLRWLIENKITDKPYDLAFTHNHVDHIGGAPWFEKGWMHPADFEQSDLSIPPTLEFRRIYAQSCMKGNPEDCPYDIDADIRPWPCEPEFKPLKDGQRFELGGRTVTAYHCPGHTPGEMIFIDDKTRTLFCGDAANEYFLLSNFTGATRRERLDVAIESLEKIAAMSGEYDRVFNFHHDFRPLGQPLKEDVLPGVLEGLKAMRSGTAVYEKQVNPLSPEGEAQTFVRNGRIRISSISGDIGKE